MLQSVCMTPLLVNAHCSPFKGLAHTWSEERCCCYRVTSRTVRRVPSLTSAAFPGFANHWIIGEKMASFCAIATIDCDNASPILCLARQCALWKRGGHKDANMGRACCVAAEEAMVDPDVASFCPAEFLKPSPECGGRAWISEPLSELDVRKPIRRTRSPPSRHAAARADVLAERGARPG
jgi:hypothetical protein